MPNRKMETLKVCLKQKLCRSKEFKMEQSHPYSYRKLQELERQYHKESPSSDPYKSEESPDSNEWNKYTCEEVKGCPKPYEDRNEELIAYDEPLRSQIEELKSCHKPNRDSCEEIKGTYSFRKLEELDVQHHLEDQLLDSVKTEELPDNIESKRNRHAELEDFLEPDRYRYKELKDSVESNTDICEELTDSKEPIKDRLGEQTTSKYQNTDSSEQLKEFENKSNSDEWNRTEPKELNAQNSESTKKLEAKNESKSNLNDSNQLHVRMSQHRTFLTEGIDPDSGLLNKLLELQILSYTEYAEIICKKPLHKRNAKLLDYILNKSKHEQFLVALGNTKQTHLVNYLESNGIFNPLYDGDWPLRDKQVSVFDSNRDFLAKNLEIDDLINELYSKEVINSIHKEFIDSKATSFEKNEMLIDILRRRSLKDYQQTIACLKKSNQGHIAEILQKEGVTAEVHANLTVPEGNVNETEEELVATITHLLAEKPLKESKSVLDRVLHRLTGVAIGHSIVNYFFCDTQEDLEELREMFVSGRLKDLIETTYNLLLKNKTSVFVALTWKDDDYVRCQRFFGVALPSSICLTKQLNISAMALGVAKINDKLYVLCREPSTVLIFENMGSWTAPKAIRLDVVKVPADMATTCIDDCLYVSDSGNSCIWRLATTGQHQMRPTKWLSNTSLPYTISMSADGSLVMVRWGPPSCLEKYSLNATRVLNVQLPIDIVSPLHSVETSSGNFVIIHTWKEAEKDSAKGVKGVCEVNRDGEIVRNFEPKDEFEQPMDPRHLALDSLDRVFLADYRGNRVMLFSFDLSKCQEILTAIDHGIQLPRRLHYAADTHQLVVAQHDGNVKIYGFNLTHSDKANAEINLSPDDKPEIVESKAHSKHESNFSGNDVSSMKDTTESQNDSLTEISSTTLGDLPFELLDMILLNAVLRKMVDESHCQTDENILAELQSVDSFWYQIIRRPRFKTALKRLLSAFYRRNRRRKAIVRNSRQYLLERLQLKSFICRLRSSSCLTDNQTRRINSSRCERDKSEALLDAISSIDPDRYSSLIDCLRQTHQKPAARALETGGVFLRAEVHVADVANRHLVELRLVQELNRLRDKNTTRPPQLETLVAQLERADIEILSSVRDNGIVVWIKCRAQGTLQKMQEADDRSLGILADLFAFLSNEAKLGIVNVRSINIDATQYKREMVKRRLVLRRTERFKLPTAVYGVTKLQNEFHFLCTDPNTIQVFRSSYPYDHRRQIKLDQIMLPSDIGANQADNCLYVIDQHSSYVWKVEVEHPYQLVKWVPAFEPFCLSVNHAGSVIMARMGQPCSLDIYESGALQPMRRNLPSEVVNIKHAVETSSGSYIFSHLPRQSETWNICEMTETGQIVRRLNPTDQSQQLNSPWHLAIDSDDRVFVADYRNGRVILLDSELRWQEVLLLKAKDAIQDPARVFVDREKRQLVVAQSITWSLKGTVDCFLMSYL